MLIFARLFGNFLHQTIQIRENDDLRLLPSVPFLLLDMPLSGGWAPESAYPVHECRSA